MTKIEIIKENKSLYTRVQEEIKSMNGLQKLVAEHMVLTWIKGNNFLGGLSDREADKIYFKVFAPMGYSIEEVYNEFQRQIANY